MILCGMDEAGYGPKLGPLAVGATVLPAPLPRKPCPVTVADSKKVYTPARGLSALERTVLSFAGQRLSLDGLTYRRFREAAAGPLPDLPWYGDFPLPCATAEVAVPAVRRWLGRREFYFAARLVEPDGINRVTNKADLLFATVAELVRDLLGRFPEEPMTFRIGKQGGRRFYGPLLATAFGALVRVETEEPDRSAYAAALGGREVIFEFLEDGEDRDFLLALSSNFAKYLREGAMRLFNAYWKEHIGGIAPTAGYGTDGTRFYREIEPEMSRLRLSPALVWRNR